VRETYTSEGDPKALNAPGSIRDLLIQFVAGHIARAAETVGRWYRFSLRCFVVYVLLVFVLAATGLQTPAFLIFALVPLSAIGAVLFWQPLLFLTFVLSPSLQNTRLGAIAKRLLQRLLRSVMSGGWSAFSVGGDLNNYSRLQFSHPLLATLIVMISIPATIRDLTGEEDSGLLGVAAWIISAIVYSLDFLSSLRVSTT
jgi:hypothetical protein